MAAISTIKVHRYAITLAGLSCLTIVIGATLGWNGKTLQLAKEVIPVVTNKTQALKVTKIQVTGNGVVEVTLLNQSPRYVDFYTFLIGEQRIMPTSGIASGSTSIQKFPMEQLMATPKTSPSGEPELVVLALSFADGGGEGDAEEMLNLEETTLGVKDYSRVVLPVLIKAANSPAVESEENIRSLQEEFSQLSATHDGKPVSSMRKAGQSLAKSIIRKQLEALSQQKKLYPRKTYHERLIELIENHQTRYSRL